MTITSTNPDSGTAVAPGSTIAIVNTAPYLTQIVLRRDGWVDEIIYLGSAFEPGFTGTRTLSPGGTTEVIEFRKDDGWTESPFQIVASGTSVNSTLNFVVWGASEYPAFMGVGGPLSRKIYLNTLLDVDAPDPNDSEVLAWDDASGRWVPRSPGTPGEHVLDSHSDVTLTNPVNGQVLTYLNGLWVNGEGGAGGTGDITGPVTSTDRAIATWNGAGGDTLRDNAVIIDALNGITGVSYLVASQYLRTAAEVAFTEAAAPNLVAGAYGQLFVDSSDGNLKFREALARGGATYDLLGSVLGPGSSTNLALASFDGISGKLLKNTSLIFDALGGLTGASHVVVSNYLRTGAEVVFPEVGAPVLVAGAYGQLWLDSGDGNLKFTEPLARGGATYDLLAIATGDVLGPASSTLNAIARFSDTGGKTLKNSAVTVDDLGGVSGAYFVGSQYLRTANEVAFTETAVPALVAGAYGQLFVDSVDGNLKFTETLARGGATYDLLAPVGSANVDTGMLYWLYTAGGGVPTSLRVTSNTNAVGSIASFNFHVASGDIANATALLSALTVGTRIALRTRDVAKYGLFTVNGAVTNNTTYFTVPVTANSGTGTLATADVVSFFFFGSAGTGSVDSVVGGTGITVDGVTNPANPVVTFGPLTIAQLNDALGGDDVPTADFFNYTLKASPAANDRILINDSAASYGIKYTTLTDLLGGAGGVPISRQIISGAGLTGGGDLSADRTLAVGAGTGIAVGAGTVGLAAALANTVKANATTGSAAPTDIAIAADRLVGRSASGNIAGVQVVTNHIADDQVTLAKVAPGTPGKWIKYNSSTGQPEETDPPTVSAPDVDTGALFWIYATGGGTPATITMTANADLVSSITSLQVHVNTADITDVTEFLSALKQGDKITVRSRDAAKHGSFTINGTITNTATVFTIPVNADSGTGTLVNGDVVSFFFFGAVGVSGGDPTVTHNYDATTTALAGFPGTDFPGTSFTPAAGTYLITLHMVGNATGAAVELSVNLRKNTTTDFTSAREITLDPGNFSFSAQWLYTLAGETLTVRGIAGNVTHRWHSLSLMRVA